MTERSPNGEETGNGGDRRPELKELASGEIFEVVGGEGRRLPVEGGDLLVSLTGDPDLIRSYVRNTKMGARITPVGDDESAESEEPVLRGDVIPDEQFSGAHDVDIDLNVEPSDPPGAFRVVLVVDPPIAQNQVIRTNETHTYRAERVTRPSVEATVERGSLAAYLSYASGSGWTEVAKDTQGNISVSSPYTGSHLLKLQGVESDSRYSLYGYGFVRVPC